MNYRFGRDVGRLSLAAALASAALTGCATQSGQTPQATSASTAATGSTAPRAQAVADEVQSLWHDPEFQKAFLGTYGINAAIEPRLSPEEITFLEKLRPFMEKDLPKARSMLESQIKASKDVSPTLLMTLGNIHFQLDSLDLAEECFRKAVTAYPSFRRAWRNLGLIYTRSARYDQAIEAFTKMIELGGGDAASYGLLGFAYSAKEDFQAAEVAYRNALLLQPDVVDWRLGLTRCVFRQSKFEDAASLLTTLIERYPDKTEFWLLQAHTYLGMKKPLSAAANLEAIARLGKATPDAMYSLGDIYVSENLPDGAVRSYCRAIEIQPEQTAVRPLQAAELLAARGWLSQSRQVAAQVRSVLTPHLQVADTRRLLKLEARLSMADGSGGAEAAKALEEIVKLDPLDGDALMLLGQHFAKQGEPDRAIFWYERAGGIDAFEATAKLRHAQLLVSMRRYGDAVPLLRRAQELKPRDDVARYLEQVDRASRMK